MSQNFSLDLEDILSLPIWFNRILKSQFDPELSQAGFNYIKDLFPENQSLENFNGLGLRNITSPPSARVAAMRSMQNKIAQQNFIKHFRSTLKTLFEMFLKNT